MRGKVKKIGDGIEGVVAEWHKMWSRLAPQICHFFGS